MDDERKPLLDHLTKYVADDEGQSDEDTYWELQALEEATLLWQS